MTTAHLIAGLGYGDEGKGTAVDWLVRHVNSDLVVRYNGGAQAAHNVVLPNGRHHTFAQFGSGTFAGARTFLSRHMLFNPISLMAEAEHLESLGVDPWPLLYISENALVTTPFHMAANRLRELARFGGRHGSCGMGIGETRKDFEEKGFGIRVKDLLRDVSGGTTTVAGQTIGQEGLWNLLFRHQEMKRREIYSTFMKAEPSEDREQNWAFFDPTQAAETLQFVGQQMTAFLEKIRPEQIVSDDWLAEQLGGDVVFEGAQGMLLDQKFGFFPYVTRTDLTYTLALDLLEGLDVDVHKIGITRTFQTRHGAGPFVSEDDYFDEYAADDHNSNNPWQQGFRSGALDIPATRYAVECLGGIDSLILTHMDKADKLDTFPVCVAYRMPHSTPKDPPLRDIPHVQEPDLDTQADLTQWLKTLEPVVLDMKTKRFAAVVAGQLNANLYAVSYGQTHEDKVPTE